MRPVQKDSERLRGAPDNQTVDSDHTPWLLTFADLLSLLLTFFVLLFSMKEISSEQWAATRETMRTVFNPGEVRISESEPERPVRGGLVTPDRGLGLGYLQTVLKAQAGGFAVLEVAQIYREDQRIIISLPGGLLFGQQDGTELAALTPESNAAVLQLGRALSSVRNDLFVGVHTPLQVETDGVRFRDPWALSLIRAQKVAQRLRRGGYSGGIKAVGYGPSRFEALDETLDVAVRDRLANRVDIVILQDGRSEDPDDFF